MSESAAPPPATAAVPAAPATTAPATGAAAAAAAPDVTALCKELFNKMSSYLNSEMTATCKEYALLERLNEIATAEYRQMTQHMATINADMVGIRQRYDALQPYLVQVADLAHATDELYASAKALDDFSKALESRLRDALKR